MKKIEAQGASYRLQPLSALLELIKFLKPLTLVTLTALTLVGCATTSGLPSVVSASAIAREAAGVPSQWQAPLPGHEADAFQSVLPHGGDLTLLSQWWQQQKDPLLVELIMEAEAVSPSISTARSNIEQARAARVSSGAALLPTLDGNASLSRGRSAPVNARAPAVATTGSLGLTTSWEVDVFGFYGSARDADQQRLEGTNALWHAARISVAAETATQYYGLLACQKLLLVAQSDANSRSETARLAELNARAGFQAPANAALASATAAEGRNNATQQRTLCDLDVKALVALTAVPELDIRQKLSQTQPQTLAEAFAEKSTDSVQETMPPVISLPAELLGQRPDIFNAARAVDAARADIDAAHGARYPQLSLNGSISSNKAITSASSVRFDTWSVGPLQITLPLFDGGTSKANVNAAVARYNDAVLQYRGTVRQAVREVEEALVNLQSTSDRRGDAVIAVNGYQASFTGTEARYKGGLASLVELEETRRFLLGSQSNLVNLQRDRQSAWVAIYRALGGGWTTASLPPPVAVSNLTP